MGNCIFCNNEIYIKLLCKNHYFLMIKEMNIIIDNTTNKYDIKNHYHNLRYSILKQVDINHIIFCMLKLIAIAESYKKLYDDSCLIEKVYPFVENIIIQKRNILESIKKRKQEIIIGNSLDIDIRKKWPRDFLCEDGHYVRSLAELSIDNWLFRHDYIHSYEKKCFLPSQPKAIIISDFYIPKMDIYIEYWGKYDKKYLSHKNAKKELYKENKINLIEINFNQLKILDDIMPVLILSFKEKNHR